ncbi:hypothetical protein Msi02_48990 [Microbispora siamensis]|uniref:Uncharacterized protein n=1 Tax=Microbispora siamensis TaxID=564413 RepID=A0ABQ4GRM7_9ACTN|nr:hypothetical protein Msi02_48990 [Microbispora siamensis]
MSDEDDTKVHDVSSALEYWPAPPPWGWTAERDPATGAYTPTGIHHGHLAVQVPFPVEVDLDQLVK